MWAGDGAFLSHGTAAWRWRIVPAPPPVIELGVPRRRTPQPGLLLHRHIVDCFWPARRVVVELDGRQHARPHQADADDDRDLWLRGQGYVVRRYGIRQVVEQPDAVIADLRAAIA
jgi:hypothetical protein